jgi:thymidylate synthase
MKQYHQLLRDILEKGTYKSAARENMPGTLSLFGYQSRYNLQEGFPLVTTKKVSFKAIVVELLWFLKGDTNIKFLVDNEVNIWNEDAYNYYKKISSSMKESDYSIMVDDPSQNKTRLLDFEEFCDIIKKTSLDNLKKHYSCHGYILGDCGMQYGKLWREWPSYEYVLDSMINSGYENNPKDQIKELIEGLKKNPMSRRHILTAWNPATLDDMALNACHAFVQFNCRPLTNDERYEYLDSLNQEWDRCPGVEESEMTGNGAYDNVPKYYIDCQMYQRSADVVLGVPYNIASYALLTEILAKICNMIPGEFVHTFGDVHIYDNHLEAVEEQLQREPRELPKLHIVDEGNTWAAISNLNIDLIKTLSIEDFKLENYNPHPKLKSETKLSTGLKK